MATITDAGRDSGDLFGDAPIPRRDQIFTSDPASELARARVLCRRLRRERTRTDKKRIAHLIFLNLQSMLKHAVPRG